jgi:hypothetical protein
MYGSLAHLRLAFGGHATGPALRRPPGRLAEALAEGWRLRLQRISFPAHTLPGERTSTFLARVPQRTACRGRRSDPVRAMRRTRGARTDSQSSIGACTTPRGATSASAPAMSCRRGSRTRSRLQGSLPRRGRGGPHARPTDAPIPRGQLGGEDIGDPRRPYPTPPDRPRGSPRNMDRHQDRREQKAERCDRGG